MAKQIIITITDDGVDTLTFNVSVTKDVKAGDVSNAFYHLPPKINSLCEQAIQTIKKLEVKNG
jgi:hypothetical protein